MDRLSLELGGNWFEQTVANELQSSFTGSVVLHDLELYSDYLSLVKGHNVTTQIDLVLITEFNIYVIEAKKWNVVITGDRDDHVWCGKSNVKSFIKNISPVEQNLVHMRALRNLLRENNYVVPQFHSYVCVPNGTKVQTNCEEVLELSHLIFKMKCDQLDFYEKKSKLKSPIDIKYWDNAISNVIRKQMRMRAQK